MILKIYKPIKENNIIVSYEILTKDHLYSRGSQRYKVSYICDGIECKTPNKVYVITREHLNEKRSKTVNDKIQICRSCQTTGENNPRYGDNRTWEQILGKEKSDKNKDILREKFKLKNPSKNEKVKIKKNQIIINYKNVSGYVNEFGFKLCDIEGDNKFAKLKLKCSNDHTFEILYNSFRVKKICRYCYYESIRIPHDESEMFESYSKVVRSMTRFTFNKNRDIIDPNGLKKNNSRKYHIDHIYSISDGYINNVDPKIISSVKNLRIIDSFENLRKGKKSEITLEELIDC